MEVNYFGTMNLLRAFADQVRSAAGGILLILSVAAVSLSRSAPAYSASKAATLMLGSSVREELREDGVVVTVSLPGWIDTEMAVRPAGGEGDAPRGRRAVRSTGTWPGTRWSGRTGSRCWCATRSSTGCCDLLDPAARGHERRDRRRPRIRC